MSTAQHGEPLGIPLRYRGDSSICRHVAVVDGRCCRTGSVSCLKSVIRQWTRLDPGWPPTPTWEQVLVSKRTFQPNNRRRAKTHGFRLRCVPARDGPSWRRGGARAAPGCCLTSVSTPGAPRCASSAPFERLRAVARRGRRVTSPTVLLHAVPRPGEPALVGFVVSRSVGGAVVRNRVKRRLRAAVLPPSGRPGWRLVVMRARPEAAARRLRSAPGRRGPLLQQAGRIHFDSATTLREATR